MASTYTSNSGIQKPGSGEQAGAWGTTVNTNFDIIDRTLGGVGTITLSGTTHTLTTTDGALSDGHYKVLILSGSPSGTNTITISPNDQTKVYLVNNTTSQSAIFTQGTGGNVTIVAGASAWIYADGAGAGAQVRVLPSDVVGDTSPQLGGDLDVNSNSIVSTSNGDINLTPNGTGTVVVGTDLDVDNINIDGNTITSTDTNGDINLTPNGTGSVVIDGLSHPQADGTAGQVLATDGSGQLSFTSSPSALNFYPQAIRVFTGSTTSYSIPSGAEAVYIVAAGGGGGGAQKNQRDGQGSPADGGAGGDTTVTNTTLSISITAKGGAGGESNYSSAQTGTYVTGSTGGDVVDGGGPVGGTGSTFWDNNVVHTRGGMGGPGSVVHKYVTGSNVGGETLTLSIGAGGAGGGSDADAFDGSPGFVQIWVW